MVAEIGIMMALYIITRCLSFCFRDERVVVKILSIITILITAFIFMDLSLRGLTGTTPIK